LLRFYKIKQQNNSDKQKNSQVESWNWIWKWEIIDKNIENIEHIENTDYKECPHCDVFLIPLLSENDFKIKSLLSKKSTYYNKVCKLCLNCIYLLIFINCRRFIILLSIYLIQI